MSAPPIITVKTKPWGGEIGPPSVGEWVDLNGQMLKVLAISEDGLTLTLERP